MTIEDFTEVSYRRFIEDYMHPKQPPTAGKLYASMQEKLRDIKQYRGRLPLQLIAYCPICGKAVYERVDTFSLNGPGWQHLLSDKGFGWFGVVNQMPSFESNCEHIQVVDWTVNLNGQIPTEVQYFAEWSERPHLILRYIELNEIKSVIHSMPIQRVERANATPFTLYLVSYFSNPPDVLNAIVTKFAEETRLDEPDHAFIVRPPWDFDLLRWVERKKLYWLDKNSSQLSAEDPSSFPYSNVDGKKSNLTIRDGRVVQNFGEKLQHLFGREK